MGLTGDRIPVFSPVPVSRPRLPSLVLRSPSLVPRPSSPVSRWGSKGAEPLSSSGRVSKGDLRRRGPHGLRCRGYRKGRASLRAFGRSSSSGRSVRFTRSNGTKDEGREFCTEQRDQLTYAGGSNGGHSAPLGREEGSSSSLTSRASHPRFTKEPRMLAGVRSLLLFQSKQPLRLEGRFPGRFFFPAFLFVAQKERGPPEASSEWTSHTSFPRLP